MSVKFIGNTFNIRDQWGPQEAQLIKNLTEQINLKFPTENNLLVNLTWFGPQFKNSAYTQVVNLIGTHIDNLFWVSSVDPISFLPDQMSDLERKLDPVNVFYLGGFENSKYSFNFSSTATAEDFVKYSTDQLLLTSPEHLYLCYNRKPKPHRINLVEKIYKNNLHMLGIITLGKNDVGYNVTNNTDTSLFLEIEENKDDYSYNNKFLTHNEFGGIPYDLLSLGRLDIWQRHFLNIVSETEFLPWDPMFITEKTWKPILGLRPFIINGQNKIYQYLRDSGFRTFNHYWPDIDIESASELELHDRIIDVIKYLSTQQLAQLYQQMLPDLIHNRNHFATFAQGQKHKIDNLFNHA